jgi:hypothetical protein
LATSSNRSLCAAKKKNSERNGSLSGYVHPY